MSRQEELYQSYLRRIEKAAFRAVYGFERLLSGNGGGEVQLTEIRVKLPETAGGQFMLVAKGLHEGRKVVAFHSAVDPVTGMADVLQKIDEQKLRWRNDDWVLPTG